MARNTRPTADPTRKAAFASGLFYLITFASSIPAALLLAPILTDPRYIVGAGADSQVMLACVLDLVNALTAVGSAVAVFSILRRHHEGLALGFVATRAFEAATIVVGIVSLLAVVSIRQAGPATDAEAASLVAVGRGLVGVRDWTFIIGPSLMPGFNALMFATVLYRTRLVPRAIPALGLIGAPLLITSSAGILLGINELGSTYSVIATVPIFFWELAVGLWMTFKGFNREATITASGVPVDGEPAADAARATTPAGAPSLSPAPARFARIARIGRFQPRPRHLLVLAGLWLAIVANGEAQRLGLGMAPVLLFSIGPRLPLLLGLRQAKPRGHIGTHAVPLFNLGHEPILPVALFALGAVGVVPAFFLAGAMAWLGQVVIDWGLGDGLRQADGSLRPAPARWSSWPVLPSIGRLGARAQG